MMRRFARLNIKAPTEWLDPDETGDQEPGWADLEAKLRHLLGSGLPLVLSESDITVSWDGWEE